jgi:diguanylate cyclase (GGDEF)-like protein
VIGTGEGASEPTGESVRGLGRRRRRMLAALVAAYGALGLATVAVAAWVFPVFDAIRIPSPPVGLDPWAAGVGVWIAVCLVTSTQRTHGDDQVAFVFSTGAIMAAALLGGPAAAGWVALIGTTELRELRGEVPWYGVVASHGMLALSATLAAVIMLPVRLLPLDPLQLRDLIAILAGTAVFVVADEGLSLLLWHVRTGRRASEGFEVVSRTDWNVAAVAEACLAWLVAMAYFGGLWWAPVVMIVADVAASRSMAHHQATWQLQHHPLTGLPNGRRLRDHADRQRRLGTPQPSCLCYVDLDGFKAVNDDHGHDVGDDVLREVGRRLAAVAGPEVFVAHLHGDEFVVLAAGVRDEAAADSLARWLQGVIDQPIAHTVGALRVSATVGTELVPRLDDLDGAMRAADGKMQARKAEAWRLAGRERRRS